MARLRGLPRSNGCAFADSPGHVPVQRMANVSLQPAPGGPSTEEIIAGVERGIYVVGDKSWSIDMQRYNFQFTGQRFYRIEDGRLAGQLRDVAYQATTTDFWGSMSVVGGPQTYVLGGAFNCGKAQPGQVAPVSHGCPSALVRERRASSTRSRRPAGEFRHPAGGRRAGAGRVDRRRPGHLRRRELGGQPPLGGQQPDHQRRDALAPGRRRLLRRRRRRHGGRHGRPHRDAGRRRAGGGQRAGRARRRPGRGRDAADRRRPRTAPATGTPTPAETVDRGLRRLRAGAGRGVRRGARPRRAALRLRRAPDGDDLPGQLHRPAAAPRPAHRPGGAQRQEPRLRPLGLGRAWAPATSATSRWPTLAADVERKMALVAAPGRAARPAATRRCCRRRRSAT